MKPHFKNIHKKTVKDYLQSFESLALKGLSLELEVAEKNETVNFSFSLSSLEIRVKRGDWTENLIYELRYKRFISEELCDSVLEGNEASFELKGGFSVKIGETVIFEFSETKPYHIRDNLWTKLKFLIEIEALRQIQLAEVNNSSHISLNLTSTRDIKRFNSSFLVTLSVSAMDAKKSEQYLNYCYLPLKALILLKYDPFPWNWRNGMGFDPNNSVNHEMVLN